MITAPIPDDENERFQELQRYNILDTDFEAEYDDIVALASYICDTPIALISFVDPNRQWFKSKLGLEVRETPRDFAFCAHAILQQEVLVIPDTLKDERFASNPLVTSAPYIRFYAGAPLVTDNGFSLGTICAIDQEPRQFSEKQIQALKVLANQVMTHLELRLSVTKLEKSTQELRASNLSKDKFFSIISHDLRAPFNGILGLAEMLVHNLDTFDQSEVQEFAKDILSSAQTAYDLVNNLLNWSRLETGALSFEPVLLQLDELVTTIVALLQSIADQKSIKLEFEPNPQIFVHSDRSMIRSILQNLIGNSIKFTPAHGQIRISYDIQDHWVKIVITDTGVGMAPDQLERLWDQQSSTTGTAGETGTGLGLLLCQQFVERHGGKLAATSELGLGSTFSFTLPMVKE